MPFLHRLFPQINVQKLEHIIHLAFKLKFALGGHLNYLTLEDSQKMRSIIKLLRSPIEKYNSIYLFSWELPPKDSEDYTDKLQELEDAKVQLSQLTDNLKPFFKNTYFNYKEDLESLYRIFDLKTEDHLRKPFEIIESIQQILLPESPHITQDDWYHLLSNVRKLYTLALDYFYLVHPSIKTQGIHHPEFLQLVTKSFEWLNFFLQSQKSNISQNQLAQISSALLKNTNNKQDIDFIHNIGSFLITRINKMHQIQDSHLHRETLEFLQKEFMLWSKDMHFAMSSNTQSSSGRTSMSESYTTSDSESDTTLDATLDSESDSESELEISRLLKQKTFPLTSHERDLIFNNGHSSFIPKDNHLYNLSTYKALARILLQLYNSRPVLESEEETYPNSLSLNKEQFKLLIEDISPFINTNVGGQLQNYPDIHIHLFHLTELLLTFNLKVDNKIDFLEIVNVLSILGSSQSLARRIEPFLQVVFAKAKKDNFKKWTPPTISSKEASHHLATHRDKIFYSMEYYTKTFDKKKVEDILESLLEIPFIRKANIKHKSYYLSFLLHIVEVLFHITDQKPVNHNH